MLDNLVAVLHRVDVESLDADAADGRAAKPRDGSLDGLDDLRARGFLLHEIADDFYALYTGDGR